VLSFSTAVDVAVARGAVVVPCPWRDGREEELARRLGAVLAVGRTETSASRPYSLAPGSLSDIPAGTRLVLPSPNGSQLSFEAASGSTRVLCGCLRNAAAVAAAAGPGAVTVVAAGERWDGGSLRPALEDLLGAGAILAALGATGASPEALGAIAAFNGLRGDLAGLMRECATGRELVTQGFEEDVLMAAALDVSGAAPTLVDGAYRA
jgi:2-phosphosulfolactate phosphatase